MYYNKSPISATVKSGSSLLPVGWARCHRIAYSEKPNWDATFKAHTNLEGNFSEATLHGNGFHALELNDVSNYDVTLQKLYLCTEMVTISQDVYLILEFSIRELTNSFQSETDTPRVEIS